MSIASHTDKLISRLNTAYGLNGKIIILRGGVWVVPVSVVKTTVMRARSIGRLFYVDNSMKFQPDEIFDIADALCDDHEASR